ncbi:LTA synthase family protein [Ectobacillus panaciterrae]|uniref:LTA synthase family protein n=1 Tax=Ectobacillus panaciterrae TaxID=363872 RepID=UPI00041C90AC|nr:LTA synthase family protein [Ectobacillus panaciterrae]
MLQSEFKKLRFVLLAVVLLWVKTYIVYKFVFEMKIENTIQEFILLLSPLSSLLCFIGLALFTKGKWHLYCTIVCSFLLSALLCANVVFYGFFNDFITLPVLFQTNNMGDLGSSILELLTYKTVLLFADLFLLLIIAKRFPAFIPKASLSVKGRMVYFLSASLLFITNLVLAETERPQLLTRSFDRKMLVKNIGLFNYHTYDAILQSRSSAQRALADSNKLVEVENYITNNKKKPQHRLFSIAKGKNVIVISMESVQNFVINNTVNGQVITPFLNDLIKRSYYFNEFYHQTGQGKTSDAEFIMENSLYPLDRGAVFFTHAGNEYVAVPEILKDYGYYSAVFHANAKSFWNRDFMYPSLGYDRYFHSASFSIDAANSVGWGLKDRDMFEQSISYLKSLPQPFYAKFITLTNHFPFHLGQEEQHISAYTSQSSTLNRYFPSVRYTDESLQYFFERLKQEGMYENTIFILYGDHYGISENHNKAMAQYLGKADLTPFDHVQLQRVPLIIHIPGHKGGVISRVSGQIDVKPTILRLLGIEKRRDIHFGEDLFSPAKEQFTILRDGSFITKEYIYTGSVCYDKKGIATDINNCVPYIERAKTELQYSDKLIYGDLLRFFEGNMHKSKENKTQLYEKKL